MTALVPNRSPHVARTRQVGLTLVELLIAMTLVALVTVMAVPSFQEYSIRSALRAQISDFSGAVRLARTEAIKRGRVVTLCRTADAAAAVPACEDGDDWSTGWLIVQGDTVIRVQPGFRNSGGIQTGVATALRFLPTGIAQGANRTFIFRPNLPSADPAHERLTRRICVSPNGATRNC